jgi:hypothetical protein
VASDLAAYLDSTQAPDSPDWHPAAPAGEREEAYREGFNNGTALCIAQLQSDADQGRIHHERLMAQHGWVKAPRLASLEAEIATAKRQITEAIGLCDATADWNRIASVMAGLLSTMRGHVRTAQDAAVLAINERRALEASHAALQAKLDAVAGEHDQLRKVVVPGDGTLLPAGQWTYVEARTKPRIVTDGLCILSVEGVLYVNIDELKSTFSKGQP